MKRKIVRQGGKALTITLPVRWAEKNNLNFGDEVEVEERERSLVINSDKAISMGSITIDIPKKYPFLRRIVDTPYRTGYDEIRVNFEDSNVIEKIEKEASNMLGFEIINQGKDHCIIKNVASGLDTEFDTMLNRLMMLTKTMMDDMIKGMMKDEKLENIANIENTNNRLCHFCRRMLNIKGYKDERKTRGVYMIVCLYEEIGDEIKDICRFQDEHRLKVGKKVIEMMSNVLSHLDSFYSLFYRYDTDKMFELGMKEKEYLKECNKLFLELEGKELIIVHHVMNILNHIKHMSEELHS